MQQHVKSVAYEQDFAAWAVQQSKALRRGEPIDVENVAEEIESLSKSDHRELRSRLRVLAMHTLKCQHRSEARSGSWASTMIEQQERICLLLEDSPSLKPLIEPYLAKEYAAARKRAALEMGVDISDLPRDVSAIRTDVLGMIAGHEGTLAKYRPPRTPSERFGQNF